MTWVRSSSCERVPSPARVNHEPLILSASAALRCVANTRRNLGPEIVNTVLSNVCGMPADPGGAGMVSAAGIHLDGTGKPTEIQISQCWVFNHARGIYMTVRDAAQATRLIGRAIGWMASLERTGSADPRARQPTG